MDLARGPEGTVLVVNGDKVERRAADGTVLWAWRAPDADAWLAAGAADGNSFAVLDLGRRQVHRLTDTHTASPGSSRTSLVGGQIAR